MYAYFLRRLLLIPPTLIGVTLLVFMLTRLSPGGPVERIIQQAQQGSIEGRGANQAGRTALSREQIEQLKRLYGFDKPWYLAYVDWLGDVLRGDLGSSFIYNEKVTFLIWNKLPISLYFGVLSTLITYGVCIPLGVLKAIRHRTALDTSTSLLVFAGYAIPSYALGTLLIYLFAVRLDWFPLGGFQGEDFDSLGFWGQVEDRLHHTTLPLACYLVGSFAFMTLLVKNHLLDNLAADFMRTAVAKGSDFRQAVFRHALRNSLIPIAATFGQNLLLILTGALIIEQVFDIDGMGLLFFEALRDVDIPILMGGLLISSLLLMLGNILSDLLLAVVDPRIRFE